MDWNRILEIIGGTTVIVGAIAWLARTWMGHIFNRDIENFKQQLAAAHERDLESLKHQYVIETEHFRSQLQTETLSDERIRQEILLWANPILGTVQSLGFRLFNILEREGYVALNKHYDRKTHTQWSMSYDYFMNSTLYLFASYFCWVRMLQDRLNFELFRTQAEKDKCFSAIDGVNSALRKFPPPYECKGPDTQVFNMQQRIIGEMLIVQERNHPACMTYNEFLTRLQDKQFAERLAPIRNLLKNMNPQEDCRWKRLKATRHALTDLESYCKELLNIQKLREEKENTESL